MRLRTIPTIEHLQDIDDSLHQYGADFRATDNGCGIQAVFLLSDIHAGAVDKEVLRVISTLGVKRDQGLPRTFASRVYNVSPAAPISNCRPSQPAGRKGAKQVFTLKEGIERLEPNAERTRRPVF